MALLDKLKSKSKQAPAKSKADLANKKSASVKTSSAKASTNKKKLAWAYNLIQEPYITEKAVGLGEKNKYVFMVSQKANKLEIKKAIKILYGVDPEKVHILKVQPKKRRLGRREGWRKGLKKPIKKAIVTLKAEDKIELVA